MNRTGQAARTAEKAVERASGATEKAGAFLAKHPKALILIALAGTVPFLSFVAEHFATKNVRERIAEAAKDDAA